MSDIVQGLFGLTPDEVRQKQYQSMDDSAMSFARLDPYQKAAYMGGKAGGGLVRAVAPMLGGVNIEEQRAQQTQGIQQQIDHSSADGLMKGAQLFQQSNPKLAMQYIQASQAMKDKESARALQAAQTTKALREPDRSNEYERWAAVLADPTSSEEEKRMAVARMAALDTKVAKSGSGSTGVARTVSTNKGVLTWNPADQTYYWPNTKTPLTAEEARDIVRSEFDAKTAGEVSGAKSGAKEEAKIRVEGQAALASAGRSAELTTKRIDELLAHPGFASSVGVGIPGMKHIPGSKEADFTARLAQIEGGAFLQAFEMLRGGGQITDVEGKKATAAMNRMNTSTSEREFTLAAEDFKEALQQGLSKLKNKADFKYRSSNAQSTPSSFGSDALPGATGVRSKVSNVPPLPPGRVAIPITEISRIKAMISAGKITRDQGIQMLKDIETRGGQ